MNKRAILPVCAAASLGLAAWLIWGNSALELNRHELSYSALPKSFDGFRVAHVSDVHNSVLGEKGGKLLTMLGQEGPDIIVITGDLLDARRTDMALALEFAAGAAEIAPTYYVPGNHESRLMVYYLFREELREAGVTVLEDEKPVLERGGEHISLLGLKDPAFMHLEREEKNKVFEKRLAALTEGDDNFKLLLSHRPEYFELYSKYGVELSLCGHTHGGQARLPLIGGIIAPHQGWFPYYDAGLFESGGSKMLISRGIGNSLCPLRFNDRPELIVVELKAEK